MAKRNPKEPTTKTYVVKIPSTNPALNVRDAPKGQVIDELKDGAPVEVYGIVGGWAKIPGGFVKAEFLEAV